MIGLYTASTLYHCLNTGVAGRIALRKYDHISIYFLIAGTYTPVCLVTLPHDGGIPMLIAVWAVALAGTVMALLWIDAPRWITAGVYLFMGWMSLFMLPSLLRNMPPLGLFWLVLGGALYTVGGVLYAVKWPGRNNPRFGCHEIFHLFILLGSVAHFFLMYQVVALQKGLDPPQRSPPGDFSPGGSSGSSGRSGAYWRATPWAGGDFLLLAF